MTSFVVSRFATDLRGAGLLQYHPCISAPYPMTSEMLQKTVRNERESVKVLLFHHFVIHYSDRERL